MNSYLVGMAEYNKGANAKLVELLEGKDEAVLREDQGSFYKSVLGTLEHVLVAEVLWLKRFAGFFSFEFLSTPLVAGETDALKKSLEGKKARLYELLAEADGLFVALAKAFGDADLERVLKYKNVKGEELERRCWVAMAQILNHGTHHRGEISALLDRKGIANDFASVVAYLK